MPITVNGIGTSYYGKKNHQVLPGTCEHCGATAALRSYDTTSYFVIAYLPVLPLGKKRILAECPQCLRHRVVSLGKWNRLREESITGSIEGVRETPADRDKVRAAIAATVGFDDEDACLEVATLVEEHHRTDPDVLSTLGDAYAYFHHHADAEQMYRAAIDLAPDEALSESLAMALMRQGRPDEAAPLVEHVFTGERTEEVGLIHLLVEAYQVQGQHEEALAALHRCETVFPKVARSKNHKNLRKISKKQRPVSAVALNLGIQVRDNDGHGARGLGRFVRDGRLAAVIAVLIVPVVLLAWTRLCVRYGHRDVHLINGTNVSYTVEVNGTQHTLRPKARRVVKLDEGEVTVRMPGTPFDEQRCVIETPFWSRPFLSRTFVLNPDRTAILLQEETSYSTSPSISVPDDAYEIRTGEILHAFADVDFEFEEFPLEISMSQATVRRRRVDLLENLSPGDTVLLLATEFPSPTVRQERVRQYLEDSLRIDPDCAECSEMLQGWVSGDDHAAPGATGTASVGTR